MKQRAVLIALVLICLVTVVGLVEVRGWEESREGESRRHRATSPGPPSASGADPETGAVAEQILQEAEDSVKRIRILIQESRRGNSESQFELGWMIRDEANEWYKRVPSNDLQTFKAVAKAQAKAMLEVRTWFTRAAEQGHEGAQMELSGMYRRKYPPDYSFMTDYILSYAWLKVALDRGASSHTNGQPTDKVLRERMTPEQVAEAEKLAAELQKRIPSSKPE